MDREEVIATIYRSLRDSFNSLDNVTREKNCVIIHKADKKIQVTFRMKFEDVILEKIEMDE